MTEVEISREATDPSGTTTYPNRDTRHYGTNLAKPQPDPDDATKVAFHDHDGHDGHAGKGHVHHVDTLTHFPAFTLTLDGDAEYIAPDTSAQKVARSRIRLTAGARFHVAHAPRDRFSNDLPRLSVYTPDDMPSLNHQDGVTVDDRVDGAIRRFTVEVPFGITNCYAFLAVRTTSDRAPFVGPMIRLPILTEAPAEESSDGC